MVAKGFKSDLCCDNSGAGIALFLCGDFYWIQDNYFKSIMLKGKYYVFSKHISQFYSTIKQILPYIKKNQ